MLGDLNSEAINIRTLCGPNFYMNFSPAETTFTFNDSVMVFTQTVRHKSSMTNLSAIVFKQTVKCSMINTSVTIIKQIVE